MYLKIVNAEKGPQKVHLTVLEITRVYVGPLDHEKKQIRIETSGPQAETIFVDPEKVNIYLMNAAGQTIDVIC